MFMAETHARAHAHTYEYRYIVGDLFNLKIKKRLKSRGAAGTYYNFRFSLNTIWIIFFFIVFVY